MYENLSPKSIKVVMYAQEAARRLNYAFVGTEFLIYGLSKVNRTKEYLRLAGFQEDVYCKQVESIIGVGKSEPSVEYWLTPRVKAVFEMARKRCERLGYRYVRPQDILWAVLDEGHGVGCLALERCGITVQFVQMQMRTLNTYRLANPKTIQEDIDKVIRTFPDTTDIHSAVERFTKSSKALVTASEQFTRSITEIAEILEQAAEK